MTEPSDDLVDIRSKLDPDSYQVLDAIARATGRDKSAIVREVMANWAKEEVHRATMVLRLARGKGGGAA
jgi:predicted transcriptional regulator